MAVVIVLLLVLVASVLFHYLNPWMLSEIASNWGTMDTMLDITFAVTGIAFILVTGFVILAVYRYRHHEGHKAEFSPDNKKLEWWLIGITTIGIVALLAPGLVVYANFTNAPEDAMEIEVVGEQFRFNYRYPGEDGEFGSADVTHVSGDNPLGVNPDDPAAQDDRIAAGRELRVPVDRPVRMQMRSNDVIHGYFVPQFRAKMDMVPGMVTSFWFTPSRTGRYQVLCTQHCGVGHFEMRGEVVVMEQDDFDDWLQERSTFGEVLAELEERVEDEDVARGREVAGAQGCMACHTTDGTEQVGPSWLGLYGSEVTFTDGSTRSADEEYIRDAIREPGAEIREGFPNVMPPTDHLSEEQVDALVAFIQSLGEDDDS